MIEKYETKHDLSSFLRKCLLFNKKGFSKITPVFEKKMHGQSLLLEALVLMKEFRLPLHPLDKMKLKQSIDLIKAVFAHLRKSIPEPVPTALIDEIDEALVPIFAPSDTVKSSEELLVEEAESTTLEHAHHADASSTPIIRPPDYETTLIIAKRPGSSRVLMTYPPSQHLFTRSMSVRSSILETTESAESYRPS